MTIKRVLPVIMCFILAAGAAEAAPLKITMVDAGAVNLPLTYAMKEGCLAEAGVAVELLPVTSGATAVLASGQVDLSISNLAPVLSAWQNGADLKVLAFLYPRFDRYVISRYPEAEASKIRTVGIKSASIGGEEILKPFLDYLKLDRKTLKTVMAKGDTVKYAMLDMGYIDLATIESYELARKAAAERKYHLIRDPYQGRTMDARVITTSGRVLKKKGPELEKFIYAIYRAVNSAAADRGKTVRLLMSEYGYSEEDASAYYDVFAGLAGAFDYVPSPERADRAWSYLEDYRPETRKKTGALLFPEYAIKAAAGLKP